MVDCTNSNFGNILCTVKDCSSGHVLSICVRGRLGQGLRSKLQGICPRASPASIEGMGAGVLVGESMGVVSL